MKNRFFFVVFIAAVAGCAVIPAEQRVYRSSVPAESTTTTVCAQAVWDGEKWTCPSTSQTVVTETVVIDNIMYGVVGGLIAGYWLENVWHHGIPRGFVVPHRYRHYNIAPRGYTVVPRGHAVPRGFRGRRR